MEETKTFKAFVVTLIIAICSGIVAFFSSCSSTRDVFTAGRATIVTVDTTTINHNSTFNLQIR